MTVSHVENRAWVLRIRDVKESDKGWYMCQVNSDPMKNQVGYLNVVGKFYERWNNIPNSICDDYRHLLFMFDVFEQFYEDCR